MSEFPIHTIETAPEGSKPWLQEAQNRFGFVPNLIGKLANAPVAAEAYLTIHSIYGKSTLTPAEQQVVALAINYEHDCHYCMAAHTGGAKMAKLDESAIEALRNGKPIPDPKLQALREFAVKMVLKRAWVDDADQQALRMRVAPGKHSGSRGRCRFQDISNYANHIVDTLDDKFAPKLEKRRTRRKPTNDEPPWLFSVGRRQIWSQPSCLRWTVIQTQPVIAATLRLSTA